ncbi:MAG: hypothetical protein J6Q84_07200 [Kiritimatiellae bacterium]|nr:hypothetical protein [Kiritimatiellia bacterium]
MTKAQIISGVSRAFYKTGFQLKKHSPEILAVAGTVGVVASAVLACKATLKVTDVISESKKTIEEIHTATEKGATADGREYTAEDSKKDLTITYAHTGVKLAKLYGPAVILGAASLGCMLTSHGILRKRYIATAAAYATIDKSFKEYRGRVVDRFGKEIDRELRHNIKVKEVEEVVVDENGKEKKVKTTVNELDPRNVSDYARFFDEYCAGWTKDPGYNLTFLKMQQAEASKRLEREGYLFLNEVYEMLGIPKSKAGQVVGWRYDPKDPTIDSFVDFGIYDGYYNNARRRDFVNGRERSILLDFNVDGVIIDRIYEGE